MVSATTATIGIDVILFDTEYTDGLTAAKYAQQQALIENCMVFVDNDTGSATGIRSFTRAYIRGGAIMTNGTPSVDILANFVDDVTIDSLAYNPTKVQSGETGAKWDGGTSQVIHAGERASTRSIDVLARTGTNDGTLANDVLTRASSSSFVGTLGITPTAANMLGLTSSDNLTDGTLIIGGTAATSLLTLTNTAYGLDKLVRSATPGNSLVVDSTGSVVSTGSTAVTVDNAAVATAVWAKTLSGALTASGALVQSSTNLDVPVSTRVPNGTGAVEYTITEQTPGGQPIANVKVWITTNSAGTNVMAGPKYTNDAGEVSFMLDTGVTYYRWRQKAGYNFTNPKETNP